MVTRRTLILGTVLLTACGSPTPPRVRTGHLRVPGAKLYYEVRGSGKPLLMIHGGVVDAGSFAAIAPELAKYYTVITYDRRGNSRSRLAGPPTDLRMDQQADDAKRVLNELTDERPHVFGSSGGAVVALELAARHDLGTVVAHEPPVPAVLPDGAPMQAQYEAAYQRYRDEGVAAGFEAFNAIDPGAEDPRAGEYPADPEFAERIQGNIEFLLAHEMLPITSYQPDIAALRGNRLVLGVAHYQAAGMTRIVTTLAGKLGTTAREFPSDHVGYMWRPREFAKTLRAALR